MSNGERDVKRRSINETRQEGDGRHWGLIADFFQHKLNRNSMIIFINGTITFHEMHFW